jgi:ATP-dependent Zn protease
MCEATAYHEAGHAYLAVRLGAQVRSLTISPDRDDGPARHGDARIAWNTRSLTQRDFVQRAVLVALAGPVAEMIYLNEDADLDETPEWQVDWEMAWQLSRELLGSDAKTQQFLVQALDELKQRFDRENEWAAIAAIADELLAHDWIEHETVQEIVEYWGQHGS